MPVSEWPSEDLYPTAAPDMPVASQAAEPLAADASLLREGKHLLAELQEATRGLGDAFARAGFAPGAWRSPDARLSALSEQLPNVRFEALLTRLAEFAADTGPHWLAGDGAALDEFAHEVKVLVATIRPLRALAQRQRLTLPAARGRQPLERALADVRVGTQLDRVARTMGQLADLAELLEPLPSFSPATPSRHEHGTGAPKWLLWLGGRRGRAPDAPPDAGKASHWLGSLLLRGVRWLRHTRGLAPCLVAGLLVLVVSGALASRTGGCRCRGGPQS